MADVEVFLAVGADPNADPAGWSFTDYTATIRENQKVSIERGKRARLGLVQTTRVSATADNTDGALSRHNPLGSNFGLLKKHCPMRVDVDGVTRATVFVTGFPPKWDPSEADQTVTLQAVGLLDRLQYARSLGSAVRRTQAGTSPGGYRPLVYYPCEVGTSATQFTSAVVGGAPVAVPSGVTPAADSSMIGSDALPSWSAGSVASFPIPGYTDTGQWAVQFTVNVPSAPAATRYLAQFGTAGGTVSNWAVTLELGSPDSLVLRGYNLAGTQIASTTVSVASGDLSSEADFYGHTFMISVGSEQDGANIDFWLSAVRDDGAAATVGSSTLAATNGRIVNNCALLSAVDSQVMGHLRIVTDAAFDLPTYFADPGADNATKAMNGFDGELADARAERLCVEENVRFTVTGTTTAAMGPQTSATLLTNLRACELAAHATLAESMDWGLSLFLPSAQYNVATPAIQLDYAASEIAPPWEPADDDHQYANSIVATRPGGSPYRAVDVDEEAEVGSYEAPPTRPPLATDAAVGDHADWSLHLALNDELTWPAVHPNILAAPALLADWLTTDVCSQLWAVNHPSPLAPDVIRQIIEGSTETYGAVSVHIKAILTPASPYDIAVVEDEVLGRADTDGTVITAAIDDNDLSMLLATTNPTSPLATTAAGDFPVDLRLTPDLRMMGEVVTVTDIDAPPTVFFQAVGTATHGSNASVAPGLVAGIATGNMLLVVAAIRNSGTGIPDTPAGYTCLPVFAATDNVQVFAKVATSGAEAAPTITFTGGVANATTSAQMARLSGAFSDPLECYVVGTSQLNASAQDIAIPALDVRPGPVMAIAVGWKQDDWTSVAALSSWTELSEASSTTGDDQAFVWDYRNIASTTALAATSFVVTGGAAAISRSGIFTFRSNVQLATISARSVNGVTRSWPARTSVALATSAVPGY